MFADLRSALGDDPGMFLGLVLGVAGMITAVLISIGTTALVMWRGVRESEHEAVLKQEMLDRGMSAQEIETVIRASRPLADVEMVKAARHGWRAARWHKRHQKSGCC